MSNKVNAKIALALCCTLWGFMLNSFDLSAQNTPVSLNYQAVARNNAGEELKNTNLKVRISILANTANGDVAWEEDHQVTTNNFGLFTLNIGAGNKTAGTASSLKNIEWGRSAHFLKVEIDFGDGTLKHMGTTQMLAVPYAFYAETSGNTEPDFSKFGFDEASNTLKNEGQTVADLSPLKQTLIYDPANYHLSISGMAGVVDLRDFLYTPQDLRTADDKLWITGNKDSTIVELKPYKQTLSVSSNSRLEISNGNSVAVDTSNINEIQTLSRIGSNIILSKGGGEIAIDTSSINEIQTLALNGGKLSLSKSGGEVTVDASETNEIQNLLKVNNKLILSNSSARSIPIDTSDINELQDLNLTGNTLKVTNNPTATSINLSKYLDNTDAQNLSRSGNSLMISGGTSVDVSDMINPSFIGFSGNNTGQSLPIGTESNINWSREFDSGNVLNNNNFVPPVSGIYYFGFNLNFQIADLYVRVYRGSVMIRNFKCSSNYFNNTFLLDLQPADIITIKIYNADSFIGNILTGNFYGYRVK